METGLVENPETCDVWGTGQPPRTHQPPVPYSLKECFTPTQGYPAFSEAPPSLSLTRLQEDAVSFNEAGVCLIAQGSDLRDELWGRDVASPQWVFTCRHILPLFPFFCFPALT